MTRSEPCRLLGLAAGLGLGCSALACGRTGSTPTPLPIEGPTDARVEVVAPKPLVPARPLAPVLTDAARHARTAAQRAVLGPKAALFDDPGPVDGVTAPERFADPLLDAMPGSSGLGPNVIGSQIDGNTLGTFTPVEIPVDGSEVLTAFHGALRALAEGRDSDGKVRVLLYGASHTDADIYPEYLRTYLQERFGDGGHGFVHLARPWKWYRHVRIGVDSTTGWRADHVQKRDARLDGMFGLMGCSVSSSSRRDYGRIFHRDGTLGSRYELYFLAQPGGGRLRLTIDNKKSTTISTRADVIAPGYHAFEVAEGEHAIEVRPLGDGEVRLFGLTIERSTPGVVVDTLGIGGSRAANHLQWDEGVWADNVARRDPSLVVLAYGTNEAMDEDQSLEAYELDLRTVLERIQRAAPDASCVLIGPGDFPLQSGDGGWVPRPRVNEVIAILREVGAEVGCGFWDTQTFMGGVGSMVSWAASQPAMARDDHVHLTRRGYVRLGMSFTDALMLDFDDALARAGSGSPAAP